MNHSVVSLEDWKSKSGNGITYFFNEWEGEGTYLVIHYDNCGCEGWGNYNNLNEVAFLPCYQHMLRLFRWQLNIDNPHMCLLQYKDKYIKK